MRRILTAAIIFASLATRADFPYYDIASDIQRPDVAFSIKRTYAGNTPYIRWTVNDGGATRAADTTNWTYTLWYASDNSATQGMAIAQYAKTNNVVRFYSLTNFWSTPNDNYYVSIIGTHTNGAVKTWAVGTMNQKWDFAANSPSAAPTQTIPWNWNLIGPYSGKWPIYAGASVTLTETPTGVVITASSGAATNGINSVTNSGDAVTASLAANVLSVVSTNAARLRVGRLSPIYGIGTTFSDGGHAAINNMNTRLDLRSTNRLHDVLGIYANNSTGMFPNTSIPGIALWNYGEAATEPFAAGTRTASLSFGLHNATSAPAMWRIYGVASGTNDMVGDLLFTSQDQSASIFERARITYDGGIVASGAVSAAKGFTLDGTNITSWSQIGGGGGSGTVTGAVVSGGSSLLTITNSGGANISFNLSSAVATNGQWNSATNGLIGAVAASNSFVKQSGGTYDANVDWLFGDISSYPFMLLSRSTSQSLIGIGPSTFLTIESNLFTFGGGTISGDGSGLTSLKAANITSNTPIQLGTGTVTAAAFIGNGAGLTNLPSSGGAATAGVSAVNIALVAPAQGITNATFTQVRASTTLTNVGGYYNTNTFSMTLPVGSYLCGGGIGALVYTNRGSAICSLRRNGTEYRRFFRTPVVLLPDGGTVIGAAASSSFEETTGTNSYDFAMYFDGGQGITNASTEAVALWWVKKASP